MACYSGYANIKYSCQALIKKARVMLSGCHCGKGAQVIGGVEGEVRPVLWRRVFAQMATAEKTPTLPLS